MKHFRVINGILLHEAVIVKLKHIVLLLKKKCYPRILLFLLNSGGSIHFSINLYCDVTIKNNNYCVRGGNACLALHFNALLPDSQLHDCQVA
jgi:hypothetical protein